MIINNLLFFTSDYKIGISSLLTDQIIALKKANINVIAVAGSKEQEKGLYNKLIDNDISVNIIDGLDEHSNFLHLALLIKEIINKYNIRIIHVQNNWQLILVSFVKYILSFNSKIKIAYTIHGFRNNYKIKSIVARFLMTIELLLFADKVVCMSNFLRNKFSLLSYKIFLLPLGISDDYFMPKFIEPPLDKGLQIVFPAQFRLGKNQDIIIKAFAKYINETYDAKSHLYLPGLGDLLDEMKSLSKKLGIEKRVTFPGQCSKSQVKDLYLKCNIAVVSSNSETFGQSIVEPYVLGRCVISRPVGIAPDIIKKENGYIFNDEKDLYNLFIKINTNMNDLINFGINNYNSRSQFKWSVIAEKYKKYFKL